MAMTHNVGADIEQHLPGGVMIPSHMFPAVLLAALLIQSGGSVVVNEDVYREAAHRFMNGWIPTIDVDPDSRAHIGTFTARMKDAPKPSSR